MAEISFDATNEEHDIINAIALRVADMIRARYPDKLATAAAWTDWVMGTRMCITAAHANGCRLDLKGLLKAKEADLIHDVFGMRRNVNTSTGKLGNNFLPRYAQLEE